VVTAISGTIVLILQLQVVSTPFTHFALLQCWSIPTSVVYASKNYTQIGGTPRASELQQLAKEMNHESIRQNMLLKVKEAIKNGMDSMVNGKFFPN
jgi:hypothetical protein